MLGQVSMRSLLSVWRSHPNRLLGWEGGKRTKNKTKQDFQAGSYHWEPQSWRCHERNLLLCWDTLQSCEGRNMGAIQRREEVMHFSSSLCQWLYSACSLCWERPTRGSSYSHDSSFASIICFPLQIAALQVGCLFQSRCNDIVGPWCAGHCAREQL